MNKRLEEYFKDPATYEDSSMPWLYLRDDLNPYQASDETVLFDIDGDEYEINLTDEHAAELRAMFADYIRAARVVSSEVVAPPAQPDA
jgi:hypothetical protein